MKRLYITDVDGTLTQTTPYPSRETIDKIKKLINDGMNFSLATGRSLYSVIDFYLEMGGKLPVAVLNGALVYDIHKGMPVKIFGIDKKYIDEILDIFDDMKLDYRYFSYDLEQQQLLQYRMDESTYEFSRVKNPATGKLHEDVVICENMKKHAKSGEMLYIGYRGPKETVQTVKEKLQNIKGISFTVQTDTYEDKLNYIDIFSIDAGKSKGAKIVKDLVDADEVVAFGDNGNDICMLKLADRGYCVAHALDSVKEVADYILEEDSNECIANFIEQDYNKTKNV